MNDFLFQDEAESTTVEPEKTKNNKLWRILIVDDDESVHQVTKLVLNNVEIEHRNLDIVSAFSSAQAKAILQEQDDFCMAFVDVVMETDDAGLQLVEWIRRDLKNQAIRLVLRTGQAGSAPEAQVIKEFDINDYKEKTDFTANKMITTVYASIRGYRDIITIQRSLDAFKKLISATSDLLRINQLKAFGSAALDHLLTLMELESSALYIARCQTDYDQETTSSIIACTGKYISESDSLENSNVSGLVKKMIMQAFDNKKHYFGKDYFVGYYETDSHSASVLYIEFEDDSEHFKANLAELYATNVVLILESLTRRHEIEQTQKELLYIVGEAVEARSKETGAHVKRVSLICDLLAKKMGLDYRFIEAIRLAAPLHDVGKIAIPEAILHKPSKLDNDEWEIMKTHAAAGAEILSKSKMSLSKLGAKLAHFHHENWDGSGYPKGLKGENIPLEARIMAIADVFDALGSVRSYKKAWSNDEIETFMRSQKGIKFDPKLIDIFLEHYEEFVEIRENNPDT